MSRLSSLYENVCEGVVQIPANKLNGFSSKDAGQNITVFNKGNTSIKVEWFPQGHQGMDYPHFMVTVSQGGVTARPHPYKQQERSNMLRDLENLFDSL